MAETQHVTAGGWEVLIVSLPSGTTTEEVSDMEEALALQLLESIPPPPSIQYLHQTREDDGDPI